MEVKTSVAFLGVLKLEKVSGFSTALRAAACITRAVRIQKSAHSIEIKKNT